MTEPQKPRADIRLADTAAGISVIHRFEAPSNPERHFHAYWELLYLVSGARSFFYENRTFDVSGGDLLLVRPGVLHRAINPPEITCELYNVFFPDTEHADTTSFFCDMHSFFDACFAKFGPVLHIPAATGHRLCGMYDDSIRELTERKAGYIPLVHALMIQLVVEVLRLPAFVSARIAENHATPAVSAARRNMSAVMEYLSAHYAEPLSLTSVAGRFGFSATHLSRTFHEITHFSFVEYVTGLRISHACRLLETTSASVTDIAFQCGFGSITQFGRCFRSFTGKSPLAYRKHARYTGTVLSRRKKV